MAGDGGVAAPTDAAVPSAPPDAAVPGPPPDLAPPSVGPVACGSAYCRSDQSCVAGQCQFSCTGMRVPGDFPNLATALDTLAPVGGTICLAPGSHALPSGQYFSAEPTKSLRIIGGSAATTSIDSEFDLNDYKDSSRKTPMTITLQGISFSAGLELFTHVGFHDSYRLLALRLGGKVRRVTSPGVSLEIVDSGASEFLVDGSDFLCSGCDNIQLYGIAFGSSTGPVTIQNSYFHDSNTGVSLADEFTAPLRVLNNTFYRQAEGLYGAGTAGLLFANNLFLSCMLSDGGNSYVGPGAHHHNGYFATNRGAPVAAGDVSGSDAQLEAMTVPPVPAVGSPLRNAADATVAPDHDYWNRPRGTSSDIGAVQHW